MKTRAIVALALVSALSACTTVTRGTKQKYPITSSPTAASVVVRQVFASGDKKGTEVRPGNQQVCTTPCFLKIKRGRNVTVTLSKPGYKTQEVLVESKVTGAGVGTMTAGNFLLGGGIGAIVDAANGSTRSLYPDHVDAVLVADTAATPMTTAADVAPAAPVVVPRDNYMGPPRNPPAPPAAAPTESAPAAAPAVTPSPTPGA